MLFLPQRKEASMLLLNSDALQVILLLYSFLLLPRKGILQCSSKVGSGQFHMKVHQTVKVLILLFFCTNTFFWKQFDNP